MIGFGAAQVERGDLARAALVGDRDAGAALQQLAQRARLAALDRLSADHLRRHQAVFDGDLGTRAGDDDLVEIGGFLRLGRERQRHRDREGQQGRGGKGTALHRNCSIARPARIVRRGVAMERNAERTAQAKRRGTPRRPPHRNQWTSGPVSGLASECRALRRGAFPCVVDAQWPMPRLSSPTVAGAAPACRLRGSPASRFNPARGTGHLKARAVYGKRAPIVPKGHFLAGNPL